MIIHIFSVFDKKASAYLPPFFSHNDATATRMFEAACSDQNHDFYRNAQDYSLHHIGSFNDESGLLNPTPFPHFITNASAFLRRLVNDQVVDIKEV